MKIQIKSLHVVDCGPIKDAVFHFDDENGVPRDTTLMTGANGSGKTTILKLILALSSSLTGLKRPEPFDGRSDYQPSYKDILNRTGSVRMDWLVDDELFSIIGGTKQTDDIDVREVAYRYVTASSRYSTGETGDIAPRIMAKIHEQRFTHGFIPSGDPIASFPDLVPTILYFPHQRELSKTDGQNIEKEEVAYEWIHTYQPGNKYRGSLNSYLIWLDYAHPDQFLAAQSVMNSIYSDGKKFEIDRPRLKVIVRTRDGGTHDLEELSSGEQNILITLIELRRRLMPHSIVLIDEIENSLHQDYQFRLGFALQALQKEVPFQLIATSHVNTFSRIFGYENLLVLPAPGTHGRQRQAAIK